MKIIYWLILVAVFALAVITASTPPQATKAVSAAILDQWYMSHTLAAGVAGVLGGALAGFLATRRVLMKPGEASRSYKNRVVWFGLKSVLAVSVCVLLLLILSAYRASDWQTAPGDRIVLAWSIMRFWGVLATGTAATMIIFAFVTFVWKWNGRRAVV